MAWISAYIAQSSGTGGVYLTFSKAYEYGPATYELLEGDRAAIERECGQRLLWERAGDKVYVSAPKVAFSDLNDPAERQRVTACLAAMTQTMIRVLKPRLEAAANKSP